MAAKNKKVKLVVLKCDPNFCPCGRCVVNRCYCKRADCLEFPGRPCYTMTEEEYQLKNYMEVTKRGKE